MTADLWLEGHAYLRPIADLAAQVDARAAGIPVLDAPVPDWEDYRRDFLAGVTLLTSADAAIDLEPGGRMAAALLEKLASETSGTLATEARALDDGAPAHDRSSRAHRRLPAGRRHAHTVVSRAVALCRMDGDGAIPSSRRDRFRRLAG